MKYIVGALIQLAIGILVLTVAFIINPPWGQFFLMSVVCTVGIALIIWLPLAYIIGAIIYWVIYGVRVIIFKKPTDKSKEHRALENYIREEKAKGVTEQEIIAKLVEKGWTDNEIKEVLPGADSSNRSATS